MHGFIKGALLTMGLMSIPEQPAQINFDHVPAATSMLRLSAPGVNATLHSPGFHLLNETAIANHTIPGSFKIFNATGIKANFTNAPAQDWTSASGQCIQFALA